MIHLLDCHLGLWRKCSPFNVKIREGWGTSFVMAKPNWLFG